jgi:hypothetical protein
MLNDYGCNREYAIKWIQMNKHNSVTSTYYLLLKNKKRDFIKKIHKSGKQINKYFEISNEKQDLIDLLMNYEPSSQKKKSSEQKVKEIMDVPKRETSKDKYKEQNKRVDNIEIVTKSKSQERKVKNVRDEISIGSKTVDYTNVSTMKNHNDYKPEFQTVDYDQIDNSRNKATLSNADNYALMSLKYKKEKEIHYIKNRRTGSTDWTNNNKLNKRESKRIPHLFKNQVIDLDIDEGEIIMSNRRNDAGKVSPSPSPVKYDIEPSKNKPIDMNYLIKASNYESVKNKK